MGRPSIGEAALSVQYNLRFDERTLSEVSKQAKKSKTTVAELIRTYVVWGLEVDSKEKQ